jgi:hypothetical protein
MAPTRSGADPLPEGTSPAERDQVELVRGFLVALKGGACPRARQPPSFAPAPAVCVSFRARMGAAAVRSAAAPRASPRASPAPLSVPRPAGSLEAHGGWLAHAPPTIQRGTHAQLTSRNRWQTLETRSPRRRS